MTSGEKGELSIIYMPIFPRKCNSCNPDLELVSMMPSNFLLVSPSKNLVNLLIKGAKYYIARVEICRDVHDRRSHNLWLNFKFACCLTSYSSSYFSTIQARLIDCQYPPPHTCCPLKKKERYHL